MFVDFRHVKTLNIGGKNVKILRIDNRQIWSAVKPSYTGLKLQAEQDNVQVGLFAQGTAPQISIQYSMDEGQTWSDYTIGEYIDLPNMGDAVCWRSGSAGNGALAINATNYNYFKATGKVAAYGSVVSLLRQDYETNTNLTANYCFCNLFRNCTSLTKAPDLPSTKLTSRCYSNIFYGCNALTDIKIGYIGNFSSTYFVSWVSGVASSGTLYYSGTDTTRGPSAIPTNWTVLPYESRSA